MKKLVIAALLLAPGAALAESPFCLVSNSGIASCFYYSIDACRQAQSTMGGMCSANVQQPAAQPQLQSAPAPIVYPDFAGQFQRGQAMGMAMRQARAASPVVFYDCAAAGGERFTDAPSVGCTVIHIEE